MFCIYNERPLNVAAHFVQHADRVAKRQSPQGLMLGGMITMIAQELGVNFAGMENRMVSE